MEISSFPHILAGELGLFEILDVNLSLSKSWLYKSDGDILNF